MTKLRTEILRAFTISTVAATVGLTTTVASAHVKWFTQFDWSTPPKSVAEITTPTFWAMLALSVVMLLVLVLVDKRVESIPKLRRMSDWFERNSSLSLVVMRFATFATLLVAWQLGTLFAPELVVNNLWIERLQFVVLIALFWQVTTPLAGLGLVAIWLHGVTSFGLFHMLDYVNVLGVAYFLLMRPLANPMLRASALPVLYATLGFSLMWLGCEKLVFPQWALYLLEQQPLLTLGLDAKFFLVAAAFIELGLGYMLMIGLFGRALSITITLVFFLTTMVFGKVEIIGHTLIHAALIVFLFEGPGHFFRPPAAFHGTLGLRLLFAAVNFVLVVFAMLFAYAAAARHLEPFAPAAMHGMHHGQFELPAGTPPPTLKMVVTPDSMSGWNIHFETTNFRFAPADAGKKNVPGEGHIHLHIDGNKAARVYGDWFHLDPLPVGEHVLNATLNTNDHQEYAVEGKTVAAETRVTEE